MKFSLVLVKIRFVLVVIVCLEKKIRWLLEQFERANPDQHGLLHESEVVSLMRNINRTITTAVICQKLKVILLFLSVCRCFSLLFFMVVISLFVVRITKREKFCWNV